MDMKHHFSGSSMVSKRRVSIMCHVVLKQEIFLQVEMSLVVQLDLQLFHYYTNNDCSLLQSNKPVVEKRRRERINKSLEELKRLVLQSLQKDVSIFWCTCSNSHYGYELC